MIDLHNWTTPNGHKVTMFLEETGLPYNTVPAQEKQFEEFIKATVGLGNLNA